MNGSRSPRRHPLVAGALAAALACAGAVVVAASPASARPYGDCDPVQTYTITNVSTAWLATTLSSGKVRGPGQATIPTQKLGMSHTSAPEWLTRSEEFTVVRAKWHATYGDEIVYSAGGYTRSVKSAAVPRGQTRRLQMQMLGRKLTVKKYAATNRVTCARGRLLYSVTFTAPLTTGGSNYTLRYALV